jgi:hypothetical protein
MSPFVRYDQFDQDHVSCKNLLYMIVYIANHYANLSVMRIARYPLQYSGSRWHC